MYILLLDTWHISGKKPCSLHVWRLLLTGAGVYIFGVTEKRAEKLQNSGFVRCLRIWKLCASKILKLHIDGCITPLLPSEIMMFLLQTPHASHNVFRFFFYYKIYLPLDFVKQDCLVIWAVPLLEQLIIKYFKPAMNNHLFW